MKYFDCMDFKHKPLDCNHKIWGESPCIQIWYKIQKWRHIGSYYTHTSVITIALLSLIKVMCYYLLKKLFFLILIRAGLPVDCICMLSSNNPGVGVLWLFFIHQLILIGNKPSLSFIGLYLFVIRDKTTHSCSKS